MESVGSHHLPLGNGKLSQPNGAIGYRNSKFSITATKVVKIIKYLTIPKLSLSMCSTIVQKGSRFVQLSRARWSQTLATVVAPSISTEWYLRSLTYTSTVIFCGKTKTRRIIMAVWCLRKLHRRAKGNHDCLSDPSWHSQGTSVFRRPQKQASSSILLSIQIPQRGKMSIITDKQDNE